MTILHTTIRYKNKMSLFQCILFSYFESGFLPKDIIIILETMESGRTMVPNYNNIFR